MDPKFRSSFIPKKPLSTKTEGSVRRARKSFNMMTFVASAIFLVAVFGSAGTFGYKYILTDQISQKGVKLNEARSLLDMSEIESFKLLDDRLSTAWTILRNHKITSQVFEVLENHTLHNVQFDRYKYSGDLKDVFNGVAANFNSLALQADIFENLPLFNEITYSQFEVDEDGLVGFSLTAQLNPSEIGYLEN